MVVINELFILWIFRAGIILLILGLFLPSRIRRRTILSKVLHRRPVIFHADGKTSRLFQFLDTMTEHPIFRPFMLKEDSDEYSRLERLIVQAGGLNGLTPNVVQLCRLLLPVISFSVMLVAYIMRATTRTVNLNQTQLFLEKNVFQGFLQPQVTSVQSSTSGINPIVIMWIFIGALFLYLLPEALINMKINARKEMMKKELPIMETFIIIMLESGSHTVYDILRTLLDTTTFFKPYITVCLNEYYIDPKKAIQNMADKVNNEEFQVVCNGLKEAVDVDKKYTATFMRQHLDQLKKLQGLQREASIKKKPLFYVLLLTLPLFNIVIIWLYPWIVNAMKILTVGF